MTSPYAKALELGYTEEQINEHFSKKDPEFSQKYKKAIELGYKPEEIYQKASESQKFNQEPQEESHFDRLKGMIQGMGEKNKGLESVARSTVKGTIEGLSRFGQNLSGNRPTEPKFKEGKFIPGKTGEQQLKEQSENLDKLIPNEEKFVQKSVRRGLQQAPTALSFPGSKLNNLPRSIAAGFMGEGAKELGLPEWAQAAAEITAYAGPDITKKLLTSGKDKEIIQFAKQMGMDDKQIAPLLNTDFKIKWLSKISPKKGATEEALKETKGAIDKVYGTIQNSSHAAQEITEKSNGSLINGLYEKLAEMPGEVRKLIDTDLGDLLDNKITGKSLINFWKDINSKFSKDKKILSTLKEPIRDALKSISPELSQDFELANKLYTKFHPLAKKLKPDLASQIIGAAEYSGGVGTLIGAAMGNYTPLIGLVGASAARKIAQQMIINPNFQQLPQKIALAANQNKPILVKKLLDQYANYIGKYSPSLAADIKKTKEEDYKKFLDIGNVSDDKNTEKSE
jgi:hypothetical protein